MDKQLNDIINTVVVALTITVLLLFNACTGEKHEMVQSFTSRQDVPTYVADSITTIVSDSGVVRYRVITPKWLIYDKADEPYWLFPQGLRFEQFNYDYTINAEIECDSAIYYSDVEQWHLIGNIRAVNLNAERFYTEELWWYQNEDRVFSDTTITIIQTDRRIQGHGFESNQDFTKYQIKRPTGIFPMEEN